MAMISIRFEIPGFSSRSWRTSVPESVTPLLNFFTIVSGGSSTPTVPCAVPPVVDIFFVASPRSLLRRVRGRDRVEVDDAEERVAELLGRDVVSARSDVVAEVLRARRLDAGKDAHWSSQYRNFPFCFMATNGSPELLIVMGAGATA